MKPDMRVRLCGLELRNPIIAASGTFGQVTMNNFKCGTLTINGFKAGGTFTVTK